jgi:lipid A ethanolaminephosphotransferase
VPFQKWQQTRARQDAPADVQQRAERGSQVLNTPSRILVRSEVAVLVVSLYFVSVLNITFWRRFVGAVAPINLHEHLFIAAFAVASLTLTALAFTLISNRYLFKPVATVLLLVTPAVAYFMNEYGIVIDAEMIRNVMHTDRGEARDLFTGRLMFYLVCLGILPAMVLWAVPISFRPFWRDVWYKAKFSFALLAVAGVVLLPFVGTTMSFFREQRILAKVFTPLNYLSATATYSRANISTSVETLTPFGADARKGLDWSLRKRRSVTVIVVGETARAANFSLGGYERDTNPQLSKVSGLIYYPQVFSCGTATAQSVPCMFSGRGRTGYGHAAGSQGLLHIIQRAGFSLLWRENQGGCAGVCKGIPVEYVNGSNRNLWELADSLDENLLVGLDQKIDDMTEDAVIVLHMMGSHGPAYYKRYPAEAERFTPACKESQFSRCERSQIVNSYDNTILYTDYILAKLIQKLSDQDQRGIATSMIYVSDHGESLGEGNIYLHGLPYAFAPDVQRHVPMMVWLSPKLQEDAQIDTTCLARRRELQLSHDNFFHSVLGLLDVRTTAYDARLDLFAGCRGGLGNSLKPHNATLPSFNWR